MPSYMQAFKKTAIKTMDPFYFCCMKFKCNVIINMISLSPASDKIIAADKQIRIVFITINPHCQASTLYHSMAQIFYYLQFSL